MRFYPFSRPVGKPWSLTKLSPLAKLPSILIVHCSFHEWSRRFSVIVSEVGTMEVVVLSPVSRSLQMGEPSSCCCWKSLKLEGRLPTPVVDCSECESWARRVLKFKLQGAFGQGYARGYIHKLRSMGFDGFGRSRSF